MGVDLGALKGKLESVETFVKAELANLENTPESRAAIDGAMNLGAAALGKVIEGALPELVRPLVEPILAAAMAHLEEDVDKWLGAQAATDAKPEGAP